MIRSCLILIALFLSLPASAQIKWGTNGHEGRSEYSATDMERRMQLFQQNKLTTYRTDVGTGSTAIMDKLVPLADKYGITLRPMLYPSSEQATYDFVRRYPSVQVWEIGNEQDGTRSGAQTRINAMMNSYRGVKRAGKQTSINIMACNNDASTSQCAGDPNGDVWFLDMAKASGFNFDYVTFHYYPYFRDKGYWTDKYLRQMRSAATKFNVPIFINETNCAEIYAGSVDGGVPGGQGCYDSLKQFLENIRDNYSDIVKEVNVYEVLDEPRSASGVEQHFGLAYDMNRPKPTWNLLTSFGTAAAPTCTCTCPCAATTK